MMQMGGFGFDASKVYIYHPLDFLESSNIVSFLHWSKSWLLYLQNWLQSLGAEKDGLDIIQHEWALPGFEHRAESVLRKLVQ